MVLLTGTVKMWVYFIVTCAIFENIDPKSTVFQSFAEFSPCWTLTKVAEFYTGVLHIIGEHNNGWVM